MNNQENHGVPDGIREHEVSEFSLEHPQGVKVDFIRSEENAWVAERVYTRDHLDLQTHIGSVALLSLLNDVEREGDAVIVNYDEVMEDALRL